MEVNNVTMVRFFLACCLLATTAIALAGCHEARAALEAGNATIVPHRLLAIGGGVDGGAGPGARPGQHAGLRQARSRETGLDTKPCPVVAIATPGK